MADLHTSLTVFPVARYCHLIVCIFWVFIYAKVIFFFIVFFLLVSVVFLANVHSLIPYGVNNESFLFSWNTLNLGVYCSYALDPLNRLSCLQIELSTL